MANVQFFVIVIVFSFILYLLYGFSLKPESIKPSFINSSFDPHRGKEEIESYLLKSFQRHFQTYFNISPYRHNIDNETNELMTGFNELKYSNFSKYSLYLNQDKSQINILKITNEKESQNRMENKFGEVSIFSIPSTNFIEYKKNDFKSSVIKLCWSSRFYGRIIGAVTSSDKLNLAIFYRVIKGHNINFRIRYFHNITCDNKENGSRDLDDMFLNALYQDKSEKENISDISQLLNEQNLIISSKEKLTCEKKILIPNYFNETSFDDFSLKGNTPINAMTIKKDIIAYSRDFDYRQLYVLKRNKTDDETMWKISYLGPHINKKTNPFFHTNSLKLLYDECNDYKILQIYLSVNSSRITITSNVIKANHTDYDENNIKDENHTIINFHEYILDDKVIPNTEDFNTEAAIKNMKRFMKPTVFSNNGNQNLIYEFFETSLFSLDWNQNIKKHSLYEVYSGSLMNKISKVSADQENKNIILITEGSRDLIYIHRNKEDFISQNIVYEHVSFLSLKKIPKKYRNKQILSFSVDKVNHRTLLILLLENGILVSTDLSEVNKPWANNLFMFIFNEINTSMIVIIFINIFSLVFYTSYTRNRRTATNVQANNNNDRRSEEINQVLRDVMRNNNNQNQNIENNQVPPDNSMQQQDHVNNNEPGNENNDIQINEVNVEERINENHQHIQNNINPNQENSSASVEREEPQIMDDPSIQSIIQNNNFLRSIRFEYGESGPQNQDGSV